VKIAGTDEEKSCQENEAYVTKNNSVRFVNFSSQFKSLKNQAMLHKTLHLHSYCLDRQGGKFATAEEACMPRSRKDFYSGKMKDTGVGTSCHTSPSNKVVG